jgi:RimJ/RimL family protein N-acetyltransferase
MLRLATYSFDEMTDPYTSDELETARLRLRMFTPEDCEELSLITSDPVVMEHIADGRPLSEEETRFNLDSIINGFKRRGFGRWALINKERDRLIGYCGLASTIGEVGVEIAYLLARPYWGLGLASEAASACLRYGFEELQLDAIAGLTRPGNDRSRRVLERLGMKYLRHAYYHGYDCVHYSIARSEFRPQPTRYVVHRLG